MAEQLDIMQDDRSILLPSKRDPLVVHRWEIEAWQASEAWGAVNVRAELEKMRAWLEANPRRQKLNTKRFLVDWLNRAAKEVRPGDRQAHAAASYRSRVQAQHREAMSAPRASQEAAQAAYEELRKMGLLRRER